MRVLMQNAPMALRDVYLARETSNMTRAQILLQAGASVLSQANAAALAEMAAIL